MTPVWGLKDQVIRFVASVAGCRPDFGECQTMAVLDGQLRLAAGVVFHNWSPEFGLMEISAAAVSRRWATREVMREAFGYVFGTADCQMAIARCDEKNTAVRKLWSAFGAQEVIIPRLRGRMASEAVLTLTDDAWAQSRFMRPHLVQE